MGNDRARDVIGGGIFLLIATYALVMSYRYELWSVGEPGSGLYPFSVSALLALVSILLVAGALRRSPRSADVGGDRRRLLAYLAALAGFAVGFPLAGHVLTTAAAFLFLLLAVERVGWRRAVWVTIASVAGSWLLFERLLGVPLPRGLLG